MVRREGVDSHLSGRNTLHSNDISDDIHARLNLTCEQSGTHTHTHIHTHGCTRQRCTRTPRDTATPEPPPTSHSPNTTCLLSRSGSAASVMKKWELLVLGPALACETTANTEVDGGIET
jgi:hypothetical protein